MSLDANLAEKIWIFLSDIYFLGKFPLDEYLYAPINGIYTINPVVFDEIESKAKSYFYKSTTTHIFENLIHWIECDFAKNWINFSYELIEKVLFLSPSFYLWKNTKGFKEIKLA